MKLMRLKAWRRSLLALTILCGLGAAIDNWLPHALISHHNRSVNPAPTLLEQSGLAPESLEFSVDYELSGPVVLRGWLLRAKAKPAPTLILLHSLGGTREDLLAFALPLLDAGFNLALVDLRSHGESSSEFFTYGAREAGDISVLVDELAERGLADSIGIVGVSAGGAVAIAAAARDDRIKAVVTLGTFADLKETIAAQTPYLPGFWRERAIARAEAIANFEIEDAAPLRNIAQVTAPVLVMHGDQDEYIPPDNAQRLYEAAAEPKQMAWILGGTHADMLSREGVRSRLTLWLQNAMKS